MKKEKIDFYIVAIVAIIAIFALVFISATQKRQAIPVYKTEVSTGTPGIITEEEKIGGTIEEKNIVGKAFRLDDCLQECQYKLCRKNCAKWNNTLEPHCFRNCLDECNNKCLKVYRW